MTQSLGGLRGAQLDGAEFVPITTRMGSAVGAVLKTLWIVLIEYSDYKDLYTIEETTMDLGRNARGHGERRRVEVNCLSKRRAEDKSQK